MLTFRLHRRFARLALALALAGVGVMLADAVLTPAYARVRQTVMSARAGAPTTAAEDAACLGCHRAETSAYLRTGHHLTSQLAAKDAILGSFVAGKNRLVIADAAPGSDDPRLSFEMTQTADGFFQTAIAETSEQRLTHSARFDIVVGSGVRGQTYLSWRDDHLFELPVSFWTDGQQWINSPGYRDGTANFDRHVNARCLECHASFIAPRSDDPQTNVFDKASFEPGIGCATCHGPGAAHVALERTSRAPHAPGMSQILNPARFTRDRQIDGCALCHNGTGREELKPAFSYRPGDDLAQYLAPGVADLVEHPDVHGNQVGLLKRSRCFMNSPQMSCATCHNVHVKEQPVADYSHTCLSCHRWQSCGASRQLGAVITRDCISCHMPLEQTNAIVSVTAGHVIRTSLRTHWIKVYPELAPGVHARVNP